MYSTYVPFVDERLEILSDFTIDIQLDATDVDYSTSITIDNVGGNTSSDLLLHLVVSESYLPIQWGLTEVQDFVCRLMVPDQNGTPLDFSGSSTQVVELSFETESFWNLQNCELIAFVQNNSTKEILQGSKLNSLIPTNSTPVIMIGSSQRISCLGESITFTDQSVPDITSRIWTFEGGTPSISYNDTVEVTYPSTGTYDVTLEATNANGTTTLTFPEYIDVTEEDAPKALSFDETEAVLIPDHDDFDLTTNFTLEAWINASEFGPEQWRNAIIGKDSDNTGEGISGYTLRCGANSLSFVIGTADNWKEVYAENVLEIDTWHHVAATYDGLNMKIYVDGNEKATLATSALVKANTTDLYIGAGYNGENRLFNGLIDEVRIWNVVRTSQELIDNLCDVDANTTGLVAYYNMDQCNGPLIDGTGNHDTPNTLPFVYGSCILAPHANFIADPTSGSFPIDVSFEDQTTGYANTWKWYFGDGNTSTEQNPTHTYEEIGTYSVALKVEGPAGNDSINMVDYINVTVGLGEITHGSIRVYPNPFNNTIDLKGLDNVQEVNLTDITGVIVYEKKIDLVETNLSINTEALHRGVYFCRIIKTDGSNELVKLVKM